MVNYTVPSTGEEFTFDFTKAKNYAMDKAYIYDIQDGSRLTLQFEFEYDENRPDEIKLVGSIYGKKGFVKKDSILIETEILKAILYDVIFNHQDYNIFVNEEMEEYRKTLMNLFVDNKDYFMESATNEKKGLGVVYSEKGDILTVFSQVEFSGRVAKHSTLPEYHFVLNAGEGQKTFVIFIEPGSDRVYSYGEKTSLRINDLEHVPETIKSLIPIMRDEKNLKLAGNLDVNRQQVFDALILPFKEIDRKQNITNQFADIDLW